MHFEMEVLVAVMGFCLTLAKIPLWPRRQSNEIDEPRSGAVNASFFQCFCMAWEVTVSGRSSDCLRLATERLELCRESAELSVNSLVAPCQTTFSVQRCSVRRSSADGADGANVLIMASDGAAPPAIFVSSITRPKAEPISMSATADQHTNMVFQECSINIPEQFMEWFAAGMALKSSVAEFQRAVDARLGSPRPSGPTPSSPIHSIAQSKISSNGLSVAVAIGDSKLCAGWETLLVTTSRSHPRNAIIRRMTDVLAVSCQLSVSSHLLPTLQVVKPFDVHVEVFSSEDTQWGEVLHTNVQAECSAVSVQVHSLLNGSMQF